ncbi:hypothetical protein L7F22_037104 [Adiantum nelumboides]|nr:hypothetical protein [Adiantum nelumboides]
MALTAQIAQRLGLQNRKWSPTSRAFTFKMQDLYNFKVVVTLEEAKALREVKEKVKKQAKVWWLWEANRGPEWYAAPGMSCFSEISLVNLSECIELKKLIRKGVPPDLRPKVWAAISGAAKKSSTVPDSYYADLCAAIEGRDTPATRQIDQDLARTFPSHPWLDTPAGHAALRRVLVAYSFRDSQVGYCQGMNYVAALLLLVMKNEEAAFWMLAVLLENILVKDCYSGDLTGCHVEQRVFKNLLEKHCPRLAMHLDDIGFDVSLVMTEWFLCLFSKSLPTETVMRVWDILFNEGARVLFRIALAIFKIQEDVLLFKITVGEVLKICQETARTMYDPDKLLKVVFDGFDVMTTHTLTNQRMKHQEDVMEELENRIQKLNALRSPKEVVPHQDSDR